MNFRLSSQKGFTLIESLVGIFIFIIIAVSVLNVYVRIIEVIQSSRIKIVATALANEQFEIIRNLPYYDVGISGSIPDGKIIQTQNIVRNNIPFVVKTTMRNVDDPFDGLFPDDTSPADYKFVQIEISCPSCKNFFPINFSTYIAPRGLETASTNGALFVRVFDAMGLPVQGANVYIENNQISPSIVINDTTDINGYLKIVDVPPGVKAYEITVSKTGYSQDQTYAVGASGNPNPVKPHATVALQQLTEISFAIDKTSTFYIESITQTCLPVGNIDFSMTGAKLIGTDPDLPKYSENHITDTNGRKTISNLEWDAYNLLLTDLDYDISGTIPLVPLILNSDTNQNFKFIVQEKNPNSLLVIVRDAGTQLPLSEAEIRLEGIDFDATLITNRGFLRQIDWSGGLGQEDFIDSTRYFDSDGNMEVSDPVGELRLAKIFDEYEPLGNLISSTFDTGSESNFHHLSWYPQIQPPETGIDSVKFQIATNNDNFTWNFIGPDGTVNSFYTLATPNINSIHNGNRYLRYKVFFSTATTTFTPNVADVAITFTSSCVPPGQTFFTGLDVGDYDITVTKSGYGTFSDTINISEPWKKREIFLTP